ncbi:MAG: DUF2085 domain-containing protein [Coriobacteriia bacterium]|nr:DUF2085 domain-containing protein [Coriobacteriia bacterium]
MLQAVLHWMGYGLCHQLPERSFFGGGVQLPVCARDTGIYIGVLVSLALISWLHRGSRPRELPTRSGWIAIALMIGAMALDGGTEYAGLRSTNNELRLITGLLAGFAIGAVITPMLNDELWRTGSQERVLNTPRRLAIWIAAVPVTYAVVYWGLPLLGVGYPILAALAIVGTLTSVNLIMVCMLPPFERRAERLSQALAPIAVAVAVAFLEMWLAGLLRGALVALAIRLAGAR